jgi:hypothetical protein
MSIPDDADQLRHRASVLRAFATDIESAGLLDLGALAGIDTWIGPTAEACRSDLAIIHRDLLAASVELRRAARVLERQAADQAALASPPGPR